jgi:protein TonB
MTGTREAQRQVPLATPFGRLAHERGSFRGVILSAAVHAALILLGVYGGTRLMVADRMPGAGPGRGGGGGGGGARAVLLFTPPAAPAAEAALPLPPQLVMPKAAPIPLPEVKPPDVAPPSVSAEQLLASLGPGTGPGKGPGAGSGTGGGTGSGRGPGMGPDSGGGGGSLYPPVPRQMILPPMDRPASVRGVTVTVRFEISERGDVMRVSYNPQLRDRSYASQFTERMKHYTFSPATTLDGRPVAAIYQITITL